MLKAIIFDAYGTLFNTGTGSVDAAGRILEKRDRQDVSQAEFYARWKQIHKMHMDADCDFLTEEEIYHLDLKKLYGEYGIDGDADEDIHIMLDTLGTRPPFDDTAEALERLHEKYMICIGSTTDTEPLMRDVERSGITVDRIFTSEMMRVYKPKPEFYLTILQSLDIKPEEALFVGDTPDNDVTGPKLVGMKTCFINRKVTACTDAPDYTVTDLRELYEITRKESSVAAFSI